MSTTQTTPGSAAPPAPPAPDLAAIKERQQATWSSGDFSVVASRIVFVAEQLLETMDVQAGWRVLDVATGSGNGALAAARRGCKAVGVDYVPALLERGRLRAEAEHLEAEFVEGDAEKLPFPDASFDAVSSVFGSMFAPDHAKAASELARVCKPGGRIGLACWTPDGYIGDMFRLMSKYIPPTPGLTPPVAWGDETHLRTIFGNSIRLFRSWVRTAVFRHTSAEDNVEFFRTYYGPTLKSFAALDPAKQESLAKDLADLARKYDRNVGGSAGGPVAIRGDYRETVIIRA